MPAPAVKGFLPLSMTPRSKVCDEQGVGMWPMWKRYESVKDIIDLYVEERYRNFLALPYLEVDKMMSEEIFYWYTPRSNEPFMRLNRVGDDYDYYNNLLKETLAHYHAVVERLQQEGKKDDALFLQLSLKYAGNVADNVYCGGDRVVATLWGMRLRDDYETGDASLGRELTPDPPMCTVRFDLGSKGHTQDSVSLQKRQGTMIKDWQLPKVEASKGYTFIGWSPAALGTIVTGDMAFVAQYNELPPDQQRPVTNTRSDRAGSTLRDDTAVKHHVRFFSPDSRVIKELDVKHGERIPSKQIPPLPSFEGELCSAWSGDPYNDIINADHDYFAQKSDSNSSTNSTSTVSEQELDPQKDTDFKEIKERPWRFGSRISGNRSGFWRWILRILLFLLLVLLVLYIIYLSNPCSAQTINGFMDQPELNAVAQPYWSGISLFESTLPIR